MVSDGQLPITGHQLSSLTNECNDCLCFVGCCWNLSWCACLEKLSFNSSRCWWRSLPPFLDNLSKMGALHLSGTSSWQKKQTLAWGHRVYDLFSFQSRSIETLPALWADMMFQSSLEQISRTSIMFLISLHAPYFFSKLSYLSLSWNCELSSYGAIMLIADEILGLKALGFLLQGRWHGSHAQSCFELQTNVCPVLIKVKLHVEQWHFWFFVNLLFFQILFRVQKQWRTWSSALDFLAHLIGFNQFLLCPAQGTFWQHHINCRPPYPRVFFPPVCELLCWPCIHFLLWMQHIKNFQWPKIHLLSNDSAFDAFAGNLRFLHTERDYFSMFPSSLLLNPILPCFHERSRVKKNSLG